MDVWRWRLIFSKAVYGNVMPLPQQHQQKTKSKHLGCSLSASSLSSCGWLGSPLLKVLPARGLSEPQVHTWKEEEACLLGQPSSVHHLCRKGLTKRCGEQTSSQRPTPASGQISGAEQYIQPHPHPPVKYLVAAAQYTNALKYSQFWDSTVPSPTTFLIWTGYFACFYMLPCFS